MNNILLTGGTGFWGRILKSHIDKSAFNIIDLGRSADALKRDISRPFLFPDLLYIQTVIHAAGKAHVVPRSSEEEREFYQVNLEGTKNLCAAIDQLPAKPEAFIFISTVAVY